MTTTPTLKDIKAIIKREVTSSHYTGVKDRICWTYEKVAFNARLGCVETRTYPRDTRAVAIAEIEAYLAAGASIIDGKVNVPSTGF